MKKHKTNNGRYERKLELKIEKLQQENAKLKQGNSMNDLFMTLVFMMFIKECFQPIQSPLFCNACSEREKSVESWPEFSKLLEKFYREQKAKTTHEHA